MGFLSFLSQSHKTANIIFTDHCIRFLELKSPSPLIVSSFDERSLPEGVIRGGKIIDRETLLFILEECIEDWKIRRRPVRFVVPDPFVVVRKISIPSDIREDELEGYLFLEIGSSIHLPFEDPVFDYSPLDTRGEKREVLLVASQEEIVESYKGLLEDAKLKPVAADIAPLALYRTVLNEGKVSVNQHTMLLHMDELLLTVSIFHQHEPIFTRPIVLEAEMEDRATQGGYEVNMLQDTLKEIEKVMNFYRYSLNKGEQSVEKVVVSGGHPRVQQLKKELQERVAIPVENLQMNNVTTLQDEKVPSGYIIALGLALKEVQLSETY
ncbi:pilus assembly protein PilM [Rossellomorea aquimaris]|uniref:type IV pilus biogenesis protein PilM n=1 Tax=Rossellomorea aquimaris TaxID=189382 RepID=UPI001CD8192A|nr:pilus assembly protein PilM [Rossellomorea aquimaris]MCA1056321.1 pilus assembly protein PilM [Rossellomorea aquimaris]